MNLGLVNLDALYNNEVIQDGVFPDSPKKMNDYYGFNSSSKNINFNLLFGIDFKLIKKNLCQSSRRLRQNQLTECASHTTVRTVLVYSGSLSSGEIRL